MIEAMKLLFIKARSWKDDVADHPSSFLENTIWRLLASRLGRRRRGIRVGFGALPDGFRDFGQRTTAVIRFSLTEIMP
jgi:hypothetical protein